MTDDAPPDEVVRAYGLEGARFEPISIGLINRTFRVDVNDAPKLVLQRLHPAFRGEVNLDIEAITDHVAARGVPTPRLVRTPSGDAWVSHQGRDWRAITFMAGTVVPRMESPLLARSAAELAGKLHCAVADLDHRFHFTRPGAHDTRAHLARLEAALASEGAEVDAVRPIAEAILAHRPPELPATRTRIIHGDLKITNVLFDEGRTRAVAILDLDTFQHATIAVEIGDALRSWCNVGGESAADVRVDRGIFEAAVEGYAASARALLDRDEVESIVSGFETISLELASRFALDAIEDRYFAWDASRFPSRSAHNRARASAQLALARAVRRERAELEAITRRAFAL